MADDVTIGSGAVVPVDVVVAADEIAAKKHQRVKISVGDDGTAADVGPSNPLPVSDNGGSLTVDGTVTANIGTVGTLATAAKQPALGTAGTASADVISVQGRSGMTPLDVQGAISVTGPMPVTDNAGSLTVDAPVATPVFVRLSDGTSAIVTLPVSLASLPALTAGSAAIGKLAANSGVDIGDVDVTSSALPTGAATAANQLLPVQLTQPSASTGAVTAFTATSSTTIWSSNASAKLRTFANDSDKDLFLMLRAAAASSTAYHVKVPASGGFFSTDYTGEVRGILSGAIGAGQVNCGEFT